MQCTQVHQLSSHHSTQPKINFNKKNPHCIEGAHVKTKQYNFNILYQIEEIELKIKHKYNHWLSYNINWLLIKYWIKFNEIKQTNDKIKEAQLLTDEREEVQPLSSS